VFRADACGVFGLEGFELFAEEQPARLHYPMVSGVELGAKFVVSGFEIEDRDFQAELETTKDTKNTKGKTLARESREFGLTTRSSGVIREGLDEF
jgi:hypothetical protein